MLGLPGHVIGLAGHVMGLAGRISDGSGGGVDRIRLLVGPG